MKFLRTISANHRSLLRAVGCRHFAVSTEDYAKRNYANNLSEYNTVIVSVASQRRYYLLRDVYDDMMLDGVKPERETFHSLIAGSMKGVRLQDGFFFRDQMRSMGLVPDVVLYNFLISTCGKSKNSNEAARLFEEMKKLEVKPTGQTFICLLNACAASGRLDQVYAIVRDMTAAGLGLNKFCYAGLIAAHKNKRPLAEDTSAKIFELVEQSKGWSSVEASRDSAENVMMGISEEELYNIPTAEYVHRRGVFVVRSLTVYHVAFHACADLKDVKALVDVRVILDSTVKPYQVNHMYDCHLAEQYADAIDTLQEMLKKENKTPDIFILIQIMRCYLRSGDVDRGLRVFEDHMNSGRAPVVELYSTLIEGAMTGYTPKGMEVALDTLAKMNSRGFILSPRMGNDLLLAASGEKTGGYTIANMIWDMMQARNITPSLPAVQAYYNGLKDREIPEDDQRLLLVSRTLDNLRMRFGPGSGPFGEQR